MVNEFKLTVVHVHAQTRCRSVHERGFTAGQKTVENPGLGRRPPGLAFGLAGRSRAVGCGSWAAGRGSAFCKTFQTQQQLDLELPQILAGESDSELNSDHTIHSSLTLN